MEAPLIRVLLFEPGKPERFVRVREDIADFHRLLGTDTADAVFFLDGDRLYALWCDDDACRSNRPENRRLCGSHKYNGWLMRGPFFVTRVRGEQDASVDEADLPAIARFVEM